MMLPFVGREDSLRKLELHLDSMLCEHGKVIFVTGEVGIGKTELVKRFCQMALQEHPEIYYAESACDQITGEGDAYQPFVDSLTKIIDLCG